MDKWSECSTMGVRLAILALSADTELGSVKSDCLKAISKCAAHVRLMEEVQCCPAHQSTNRERFTLRGNSVCTSARSRSTLDFWHASVPLVNGSRANSYTSTTHGTHSFLQDFTLHIEVAIELPRHLK